MKLFANKSYKDFPHDTQSKLFSIVNVSLICKKLLNNKSRFSFVFVFSEFLIAKKIPIVYLRTSSYWQLKQLIDDWLLNVEIHWFDPLRWFSEN